MTEAILQQDSEDLSQSQITNPFSMTQKFTPSHSLNMDGPPQPNDLRLSIDE